MKKLIPFVLFLLTMQLSFCQENYPRKQVQQGDTVVVILPNQLALMNGIIQERNNYKDELIPSLEHLIVQQDTIISLYQRRVESWERIDEVNQSIIKRLEEQNSEVLRQKKGVAWKTGSVCLGIGFIAGMILFMK